MTDAVQVALSHPENVAILKYLQAENTRNAPPLPRQEKEDRWYVFWREHKPAISYGAHPDACHRLFEEIARSLKGDVRQTVYGRESLVHPETGVLLGFVQGMCYALRLSSEIEALSAGFVEEQRKKMHPSVLANTLDWEGTVRGIGEEWIPGRWNPQEEEWFRKTYGSL